jgi:hypothetical protein
MTLYVRQDRIKQEVRVGLMKRLDIPDVKVRVEQILSRELGENKRPENMMSIVLILSSPNCSSCISELLFWNSSAYQSKFHIVGIFPSSANGDQSLLRKSYHLNITTFSMSQHSYEKLVGIYSPLVTRVVLSKYDKILLVSDNTEKEVGRQQFLAELDKL